MKRLSTYLAFAVLAAGVVALTSCGNPLEGGSDPSGSVLRVTLVEPSFGGGDSDAAEADIHLTICDIDDEGEIDFEDSLFNEYAVVSVLNESRPNTPEGSSTNSFVTMNRYRVGAWGGYW